MLPSAGIVKCSVVRFLTVERRRMVSITGPDRKHTSLQGYRILTATVPAWAPNAGVAMLRECEGETVVSRRGRFRRFVYSGQWGVRLSMQR